MNQRERQKAHTREQILGSAIRMLKTEGLHHASVAEVMASAGLTVGGFYAHFSSKDGLAQEAITRALDDRRGQFVTHFSGLPWRERISAAIEQYFSEAHRDDPANGCPISMAAIEAISSEVTQPAFAEGLEQFAQAFEHAAKRADMAPREASLGAFALMVGGMILARATQGTPLSDDVLRAASAFGKAALSALTAGSPPGKGNLDRGMP